MILEFYGRECEHCNNMKPVVERLRNEGVSIESYEVWHNDENSKKLDEYDKESCGGVPFYINPETKQSICGETTYEKLKKLATA
jgi:hypothetical protein